MTALRFLILPFWIATSLVAGPMAMAAETKPAAKAPAPAEIGMQQARDIVLGLPEVQAWQDKRREEAEKRDKAAGPAAGILTGQRLVGKVKHWAVTFYENPQTEARKWAVFLVRARDGKLFVEADGGRLKSLEDWRKTRPAV
jgi:hypothetical protein